MVNRPGFCGEISMNVIRKTQLEIVNMMSIPTTITSVGSSEQYHIVYLLPRLSLTDTYLLGVKKKIFGQLDAFHWAGWATVLIDTPYTDPNGVANATTLDSNKRNPLWRFIRKLLHKITQIPRNIRNAKKVVGEVRKSGDCIVYLRHTNASPGLVLFHLVIRMLKNVKFIYLEIPTWPYQHEKTLSVFDRFCLPLIGLFVNKIVTFGSLSKIAGVDTINITNGVSINDAPIAPLSATSNLPFKFIFVGQLHSWAGIDRFLIGLADYLVKGNVIVDCALDVVGEGLMMETWKELSEKLCLQEFVTFHGNCSGDSLNNIFKNANVGVGNLANHRRKLIENADLKNRDYCMRGIPFIVANADSAFPDNFPFWKRIPANDSPVNVQEVMDFYANVAISEPEFQNSMRKHAIERFSWQAAMRPLIEDLERLKIHS